SSRARAPRANLADLRDGAGRSPRGGDRLVRLHDGRLLAGIVLSRAGGPGYLECRPSEWVVHRRAERRRVARRRPGAEPLLWPPAYALLERCDARVDLRHRRAPFINAPPAPGRTSRAHRETHRL